MLQNDISEKFLTPLKKETKESWTSILIINHSLISKQVCNTACLFI